MITNKILREAFVSEAEMLCEDEINDKDVNREISFLYAMAESIDKRSDTNLTEALDSVLDTDDEPEGDYE